MPRTGSYSICAAPLQSARKEPERGSKRCVQQQYMIVDAPIKVKRERRGWANIDSLTYIGVVFLTIPRPSCKDQLD